MRLGLARQALVTLAVVAGLAVVPDLAGAATRCVNNPPGCVGTAHPTISSALAAANDNDTIEIAAGSYPEGPLVVADSGLTIRGARSAATTISGGNPVLTANCACTLSDFGVTVGGTDSTGLEAQGGSVERIRVRAVSDSTQGATGIAFSSPPPQVVRDVDVELPFSSTIGSVGISGSGTVEDSVITAGTGFLPAGAPLNVKRVRILASKGLNGGGGDTYTISSSLIRVAPQSQSQGGGSSYGVRAQRSASGSSTVNASNLTIIGDPTSEMGVAAQKNNANATVNLSSTVIRGFSTHLLTESAGTGTATLNARFSDYATKNSVGGGTINEFDNQNSADPRFRDPAALDFRLLFSSPLIDKGEPAAPPAGESTTDLAGLPRVVNGRRDIGAFEYQRLPPSAGASATPTTVLPGQPVAFDGSGSDPEGEALSYSWAFDDGTTDSGASVTHAFSTPGTHTGTLTVTDPTSQTAVATAAVEVVAPPPDTEGPLMAIGGGKVRLSSKGRASIKVGCPGSEPGACAGTLRLDSAKAVSTRTAAKRRILRLGKRSFTIAPGKTAKVEVKISKTGRKVIKRRGSLAALATADARDVVGNARATSRALKLLPPKKRRK